MPHTTKWTARFYMGDHADEKIYLSAPRWNYGWYWGFGYLGNKNCHYHLSGLNEGRNQNLYDAIKEHFGDTLRIGEDKLWVFCELVQTAYTLKETAEVLGRGGSHLTNNPCSSVIKNEAETARINEQVLPALFDALAIVLDEAREVAA